MKRCRVHRRPVADAASRPPRVSLRAVTADGLRAVDAVLDDRAAYSLRVDGVPRRGNAASDFAQARPPGCAPPEARLCLARGGDWPAGLPDLMGGYPTAETAFLGLPAICAGAQGSGLGRALDREVEQIARKHRRARKLRSDVVKTNPVPGFRLRMGLRATGEGKAFQGERVTARAFA